MSVFRWCRTRCACSAAFLLLIGLGAPRRALAQQADEALVGVLARLLAAADARRFDAPLLGDALQHPDPAVRRQAALAAGRIGDPAAVDLLVGALADSIPAVRAAAAFGLGLLHQARATGPLVTLARAAAPDQQGDPEIQAVTALARIGGDSGARAIQQLLDLAAPGQPVSPVVAQAILESWRLGRRAAVPALLRFAADPNVDVRWRVIYTLGRARSVPGVPVVLNALQDADPRVRAIAARGVSAVLIDSAGLDRRGVAARLGALLGDRDAQVRINVLRALASLRDSTVASAVAALASDADVNVAVQAETTLGAGGGSVAIAALRARIASPLFALRRQAVIGLAQADTAAGAVEARGLAADPDWRWHLVAAEAFAAARSRPQLETLLADPDGRVVAQALQGLQRVVPDSDAALRARARELLAHADPAVRSVAADLLARHPDPADVDRLAQAYARAAGDPFDDAALSAVSALAAIARASAAGRLAVATRFLGSVRRPDDYLVRRLAVADTFSDAAAAWGPDVPIATGRSDADYRDIARRYLVPALTGQPNPQVTIETDRGRLTLELLPAEAPITVAAFLGLVDRRYFDGGRWHRVVPNFVIQDGDPRGDGWGGPGFVLRDEVNPVRYQAGTMGMALSGPDTGGSQFFITHSPQPHLDGIYPVFGRMTADQRTLPLVAIGDRIRSIHR